MAKKIIIINGPNLNLTGKRQEKIYGEKDFDSFYNEHLLAFADKQNLSLEYFQSNHEGNIIDKIHECIGIKDFIIINPGALTHYSYAIHDALLACKIPTIEVHISNIHARENWRKLSVISPAVKGVISGFGLEGYLLALRFTSQSSDD
ncbi:MAG: type II 3-dehydroquinate dehydratase [Actinobacteria bacterium]|nr:type II 3-dehydroquinate dehydratase [Cyanobacteriota bacterium]MCL6087156.1 type II 3-dehydroquinate dehydratase [Actinomycetota bacterium]